MAFSPDTGLVYIPTQHAWFPFMSDPDFRPAPVGFNVGVSLNTFAYYQEHPEEPSEFSGHLLAFNPVTGREVWRSDSNMGPTGGALATAGGLVFQGSGSGSEFRAFDAATGEKLWSTEAQTGVLAGAITYELDGRQYIAISVGGNQAGGYFAPNYSRLLVYTLGGTAQLPPVQEYSERPLAPPPALAAAEEVARGKERYDQFCAACHGDNGQTRGAVFPDLTRTPFLHSQEGFDQVVLEGVREARGMGSFAAALGKQDSAAIRAFLIARANELLARRPEPVPARAAQDVHADNAQ